MKGGGGEGVEGRNVCPIFALQIVSPWMEFDPPPPPPS